MKRALLFLFCLMALPSWGAISLVNKSGSTGGGASPYAQTVSWSAGNDIVCMVEIVDNTKAISSVVSNAGAGNKTFTESSGSKALNSTLDTFMEAWYLTNAAAATSVTVTATASIGGLFCFQYANAGVVIDTQSAVNNLAAAASQNGPAITTSVSGDVIVAGFADSNSCASANSPYNTDFIADSTSGHCASDHIISGTVSAEKATFNDSSTGGGCISAIALEPPASGGASGFNKVRKLEELEEL
jgi:hypothetical protein